MGWGRSGFPLGFVEAFIKVILEWYNGFVPLLFPGFYSPLLLKLPMEFWDLGLPFWGYT